MKEKDKLATIRTKLARFVKEHGLIETGSGISGMGEGAVCYEGDEFCLQAWCDRGTNGIEYLSIGTKVRRRPRAHLNRYLLSRIRGYGDGLKDHYPFQSLDEEIEWLTANADTVMNSAFLNRDDLRQWNVEASRRMWRKR